jgi:glycosyltransferase involved in cell wall biosynthesis
MRIAILSELFFPHVGGTEFRLYEIAKRLVGRGHEVDVFTIQHSRRVPNEEEVEGIQVHRYAYSPGYVTPNGLRSIKGVVAYALSTALKTIGTRYDLYYFGQWPLLHALLGRPPFSHCVLEWCEVWRKQIVPLEKTLARVMNNHVAVAEFTKRRMTEFLHLDPARITVIPNGVDLQRFGDNSASKTWGRLVYIGRVAPHKGLEDLIDAFRIIKEKDSQVELLIAGSGTSLANIKEYAKGCEGIQILGRVSEEEKVELLRSSWLFTMPSTREGFPLAPLEAMAAGTPVLTLDHQDNGLKDICTCGNGVVTSPDSASIASTVLELLSNEEEWKSMRKESILYAEQHDWDRIADQAEDYFSSLLNI